jgi:hypothetical protein
MTTNDDGQRRHWNAVAGHWRHLGPPLCPSEADVLVMRAAVQAQADRCPGQPLRAFLLGVTPEIAGMDWPHETELLAVDRAATMIREVWPGDAPGRRAVCADWFVALPGAGPFDVVIGDGTFNQFGTLADGAALAQLIHQALAPGGIFVMRLFVEPEERESPADVFRDLSRGMIGSFHVFKFRLAMALQAGPGAGVRPAAVWQAWAESNIDEAELHTRTGWPIDVIRTIHLYRDSSAVYCFPTLRQAEQVCAGRFDVESISIPDYEMAERFPTLVLRRRDLAHQR